MIQQTNNDRRTSHSSVDTADAMPRNWPHGPTRFERRFGNNLTRIVVAIVAIPLILGVVFLGGWWFALLVGAMSTGALLEFYWMLEKKGIQPNKALGVVAGLFLLLTFAHRDFAILCDSLFVRHFPGDNASAMAIPVFDDWSMALRMAVPVLAVILLLATELRRDNRQALKNSMGTVTGLFYVSFLMGTLLGLHHLAVHLAPLFTYHAGKVPQGEPVAESAASFGGFLVLIVLVGIWTCDSFAYFGGRAFGKRKLFERVSPKKTWEGAICGALAAIAACVGLTFANQRLTWYDGLFIGIAAGVFGQIGDLVESHIKRACEVKDSSQLIPGHGGVLDRFDSLLFVAPLVYLYMVCISILSRV